MKYFLIVLFLTSFQICSSQENDFALEAELSQTELNGNFKNPETTILIPSDFKEFTGLDFYPINLKYRVEAKFVRTPNEKPFLMPTTTNRKPEYVKYGEAHFSLDGKDLKLNLYKNTQPYKEAGYEDYLFLPYTDLTSGDGSYGGGKFLDCRIPKGETIVLDFNKAYNPYCAYNSKYSCPIPPKENDLLVRIEAGVKNYDKH